MSEFLSLSNLRNLVKQKSKLPRSFQNISVFETKLFDSHKLATAVLKQHFLKLKPKLVHYRECWKFCNNQFRAELDILKHDISNVECQHFLNLFVKTLDKHAPLKQKYLRANQ